MSGRRWRATILGSRAHPLVWFVGLKEWSVGTWRPCLWGRLLFVGLAARRVLRFEQWNFSAWFRTGVSRSGFIQLVGWVVGWSWSLALAWALFIVGGILSLLGDFYSIITLLFPYLAVYCK